MLPDLDYPAWIEALITLGIVATAVGATVALLSRTVRGLRFLERVSKAPDGVADLAEQVADLREGMARIEDQLTSDNHGSIREQVNWIVDALHEHFRWSQHVLHTNGLTDPHLTDKGAGQGD